MKPILLLIHVIFSSLVAITGYSQENAAPSMHLSYGFATNAAMLKMQRINIAQTAKASFFEVNYWQSGYTGLQDTNDTQYGASNLFISSMWDVNTAAGLYSRLEYNDPTTYTGRFGGEGDGTKTINPYNWKINNWYTIVNRSWYQDGRLYVATFIKDDASAKWFHTATFSLPTSTTNLNAYNDAFLENWTGIDPAFDGRFIRKAFFKDLWNINASGAWEKNISTSFTANDTPADASRNGIYHNSFNAYYDATQDAYCMQHGGNTTPSAAFNGGRTLNIALQANQGSAPVVTIGSITSSTASYAPGTTTVNWVIDQYKTPQLSTKIEIINDLNAVVATLEETKPEKRAAVIAAVLPDGNYTARVSMTDIFNQAAVVTNTPFTVGAVLEIPEVENQLGINVYPNPATSYIIIEGKNLKAAKIIEISGRIVLAHTLREPASQINISHLRKGTYLVIVTNQEDKSCTKKIVVK